MELGDILFPLVVIYLMMCIFRDIKTMWCSAWAPKHIVAKPKPCNTGASAKTPPNDAHKEVYMLPGQKSKAMHGSKRPKRNTFCFVMHVYAVHQILDIYNRVIWQFGQTQPPLNKCQNLLGAFGQELPWEDESFRAYYAWSLQTLPKSPKGCVI